MPLDLHVLSLQLAFILSQDQTLHCKSIVTAQIKKKLKCGSLIICPGRSNSKSLSLPIYIKQVLTVLLFYPGTTRLNHQFPIINLRSTCSCTTCIVYVNLFKDRSFHDCCSFQKADAKVRTLKHIFQIFSEVFFIFSFFSFLVVSLVEREAKRKRKKKKPVTVS